MGDHRERLQAHRRTADHRRQQPADDRIQHAGRNRHADTVVDKGEEQVLTDVAKRCPRRRDRLMNAGGMLSTRRDTHSQNRSIRL